MVSTFPELTIRLGTEYYFLSTRRGHSARDTQETHSNHASIYKLLFIISRVRLPNCFWSAFGHAPYESN